MNKYFIVTGSSKGLGEQLCKQLLADDHHVIGLSRNDNKALHAIAKEKGYRYSFVQIDLSKVIDEAYLINEVYKKIDVSQLDTICLINNAGIVTPLGPIENARQDEISAHIQTNLLSPIVLTSQFTNISSNWNVKKIVINISSASAKYASEGMSVYCATKAAISMFSDSVSIEQKNKVNGVNIYAVDPGMVDTEMQATARTTQDFALRASFDAVHKEGLLRTTEDVATEIINQYIFNIIK